MRRNIVLIFCAVVMAALCFCGIAGAQETAYPLYPVDSELYSHEDIEAAAGVIMEKFSSWEGCELYRLEYAGDARSLDELENRV